MRNYYDIQGVVKMKMEVGNLQLPLLAWILQGIPECLASTALVMIVGTGRLQWDKIVFIGLCQACLAYLVRLLPITFGVHTIFLTISLAVLVSTVGKVRPNVSLAGSILVMFVIIFCETCGRWVINLNGLITNEEMVNSVFCWVLMGLPQIIILSLLVLMFKIKFKNGRLLFKENDNLKRVI